MTLRAFIKILAHFMLERDRRRDWDERAEQDSAEYPGRGTALPAGAKG